MPPRMHKSHRFDIKNPKIFWGGARFAPSPDPTPSGEGVPPPHTPPSSAPSAPRFSTPPLKISGYATANASGDAGADAAATRFR